MTLDFRLAVRGDLHAAMQRDIRTINQAIEQGVREETRTLRDRMRQEVGSRLGGRRAPRTVGEKIFRDGPGDVTGLVHSRWWRRSSDGDPVDVLAVHARGARIESARGGWLLIPARGTSRRIDRIRRDIARVGQDPKLAIIPQGPGRAIFVRRTSRRRTTIIAFLRRRVRVPARLDIEGLQRQAERDLPEAIDRHLGELERE